MAKNQAKPPAVFTRESLVNFKLQPREFTIKGYGSGFVRVISSGERMKLQELYTEGNTDPHVPEKTVILGVCDEKGQPLFSDSDIEDVKALPADLVQAMALAVVKANGMQPEDVQIAEGK